MKPEDFANRVVEHCESTNDLARQLGEAGYPHGTWVSAREQGQGRGRMGRKWESLEGNLFLSVLCRIEDRGLWTWIPLATAVGAAKALGHFAEVRIKWPNDLWVGRAKLGGVLCEAVGSRNSSYIIAGIGVNCARHPEGLDQDTVSLAEVAKDPTLSADRVRMAVIDGILSSWEALVREGSAAIAREYEARAALAPGSQIEWAWARGSIVGLGPSGELRVKLDDGNVESLYAEDVKVRARG